MFAWTRKAYRAGALGLVLAGSLAILAAAPALSAATTYSLDQCTNGAVKPLTLEPCLGSSQTSSVEGFKNWVDGDANGTKAHWQEGDFVPYRVRISGIQAGTHTLEIHYDEVSGSKHAFDYLGSYDASETTSTNPTELHANKNNPCTDLVQTNEMTAAECDPTAVPTDHKSPIPIPTLTDCGASSGTGPALTSSPGNVVIFGPAGTSLSTVEYHEQNIPSGKGSCSTSIDIKFTSPEIDSTHTIVIAWGGHIASEADWGTGNSAGAINGSPYHMYVDGLDGTGGAVDHQLSTSAIVFKPSITRWKPKSTRATAITNRRRWRWVSVATSGWRATLATPTMSRPRRAATTRTSRRPSASTPASQRSRNSRSRVRGRRSRALR